MTRLRVSRWPASSSSASSCRAGWSPISMCVGIVAPMARPSRTHVMLTMREVGPDGFLPADPAELRAWNATALLQQWRENWASHVNERLARHGIDTRIDHRSMTRRGSNFSPQHKLGAAGGRLRAAYRRFIDWSRAELSSSRRFAASSQRRASSGDEPYSRPAASNVRASPISHSRKSASGRVVCRPSGSTK